MLDNAHIQPLYNSGDSVTSYSLFKTKSIFWFSILSVRSTYSLIHFGATFCDRSRHNSCSCSIMSNPTPHAGEPSVQDFESRLRKLIAKRTYKKGSITKRIKNLERVVSEGERADKVSYMLQCLIDTFTALQEVCEEISLITQHKEVQWHLANEEWVEAEKERVDLCAAEVNEYLEAKKDDPMSSASSFTETWVRAHAPSDVSHYAEVEEDLMLGATAASLSSSTHSNVVEDTIVEQFRSASIGQRDAATAVTPAMEHYMHAGARPREPPRPGSAQPLGMQRILPSLPSQDFPAYRDSVTYGEIRSMGPLYEMPMRPSSIVQPISTSEIPFANATFNIPSLRDQYAADASDDLRRRSSLPPSLSEVKVENWHIRRDDVAAGVDRAPSDVSRHHSRAGTEPPNVIDRGLAFSPFREHSDAVSHHPSLSESLGLSRRRPTADRSVNDDVHSRAFVHIPDRGLHVSYNQGDAPNHHPSVHPVGSLPPAAGVPSYAPPDEALSTRLRVSHTASHGVSPTLNPGVPSAVCSDPLSVHPGAPSHMYPGTLPSAHLGGHSHAHPSGPPAPHSGVLPHAYSGVPPSSHPVGPSSVHPGGPSLVHHTAPPASHSGASPHVYHGAPPAVHPVGPSSAHLGAPSHVLHTGPPAPGTLPHAYPGVPPSVHHGLPPSVYPASSHPVYPAATPPHPGASPLASSAHLHGTLAPTHTGGTISLGLPSLPPGSSHTSIVGGSSGAGSDSSSRSGTGGGHRSAHAGTTGAAALSTHGGVVTTAPSKANDVDAWIDELAVTRVDTPFGATHGITPDVTMTWLVQQTLPRVQIPEFDGTPLLWVEFVTKFRDMVHNPAYLNDVQRKTYLLQHLKGEAKRAVKGFTNDSKGYVLALKQLKFLFGQKSKIAQAALAKVTQGKVLESDENNSLSEFYFTISDCLVMLDQLRYDSDLYSSDTLRQAAKRLPVSMHTKWAEHILRIRRRGEEPNLIHLGDWLQERMLARKELPERPKKKEPPKKRQEKHTNATIKGSPSQGSEPPATPQPKNGCLKCGGKHPFWKCKAYKDLGPKARYNFVKSHKRCFNCFAAGHSVDSCPSPNTCFTTNCSAKHHTSLHSHFVKTLTRKSFDTYPENRTPQIC